MSLDTSQTNESSIPKTLLLDDEEELLVELAEAVRGLGERATVQQRIGGPPVLLAVGVTGHLNEVIRAGRREDGSVVAYWSWGDELPDDIDQAAAAVRRVVNPQGG
ncbi:hypothetical protein [Actinomadura harenae]|uniref:Uncharacterized protein n=1 Tax=Actinomadura harenae TaxID=2483351 RepID=A0A3M2LYM5_9ACTN|nr:hypothetical protein [Actinomadura harenae]RMI41175.1 hypothetical protein EBO15_23910 [Actinomadura harenae]